MHQALAVGGEVINRKGRRRQQQHDHGGQHNDRHRLALDRLILKSHSSLANIHHKYTVTHLNEGLVFGRQGRRKNPACQKGAITIESFDWPCDNVSQAQTLRPKLQLLPTMKFTLNRRSFLKHSALAAGAVSASRFLPVPNLLAAPDPGGKLNCVQIGCGGRGMYHLDWLVTQSKDNLVAIVDADEKNHAKGKRWPAGEGGDPAKLQVFTDYRVMYDKIGKQIDAVFIATPNHHHTPAAMLAMQLGKAVY